MSTAKQPKEQPVATKQIAPDMPDFGKMTITERMAWIEDFKQKTIKASEEEFEEAVNYCVKTAKSLGRNVFDVMGAIYKLMSVEEQKEFVKKFAEVNGLQMRRAVDPTKPRAARGTAPKKEVPFVRGTLYKDPTGQGKEWRAGGLGAKPKWLADMMRDLSFEDQKKKYAELAA